MTTAVLAQSSADTAALGGLLAVFAIFYIAIIVFMIVTGWKIFTKAGEEGWKVIIPIYNYIVALQIVGRPLWWIVLFLIPIANIVVAFIVAIDLAKSFGKDTGFGIGIALLGFIFLPILAFGDSRYIGPAGPEPRPGYPNVGPGGYAPQSQGYYQPPGGYPQQGGYQQAQPGGWGQQQQPGGWGQQPPQPGAYQEPPQQGGWGQQPSQPGPPPSSPSDSDSGPQPNPWG